MEFLFVKKLRRQGFSMFIKKYLIAAFSFLMIGQLAYGMRKDEPVKNNNPITQRYKDNEDKVAKSLLDGLWYAAQSEESKSEKDMYAGWYGYIIFAVETLFK